MNEPPMLPPKSNASAVALVGGVIALAILLARLTRR
jgi:hypothetical protein